MKSKKYQLLSYWYNKNKTLVSILKFTVIPTRKCLKKEKYCKSTNETGEPSWKKKNVKIEELEESVDYKCRYNKIKTTLFIFLVKFHGIDPEMCNETQKCRCLLRCCWKIYPRSFLIAWKSVDRVTLRQQKVDVGKKQLVPLVGESDMTLYTNETSKGREPTRPDNPPPLPRILKWHIDI